MRASLPVRTFDKFGSGKYGASRGRKKHKGIDYACVVGTIIYPHEAGTVTKIGYPYGDDLSYRYVEVTNGKDYKLRYFYIEPMVNEGQMVTLETPLGKVQNLNKRYKGITIHCHFEIKSGNRYLDPVAYIRRSKTHW